MKDYYELLEVNKNASEETIKKVFRMLIKKNHPDLFAGKEKRKAEEKVKKLNEAYAILSNKEKREKYNQEMEQNTLKEKDTIETLIKENEYLKSVIQEKNKLIKEYLKEMGIDTRNIASETLYSYEDEIYEEKDNNDKNIQEEAYKLYQSKELVKNILYITLMIIVGIIVLKISTGVNFLEILVDVFKYMF